MTHLPRFTLILAAASLAGAAAHALDTGNYHQPGRAQDCGTYNGARLDLTAGTFMYSGESAVVDLADPVNVRGLDAVLYDATTNEEGFFTELGRYQFIDTGIDGRDTLLVVTPDRTWVLHPCP